MKETFLKIWNFSRNRHKDVIKALVFSFLRSAFSITQILAIVTAVEVCTLALPPKTGLIRIGILTLLCIGANFIFSYFEQSSTMKTGFFMVADKRIQIGGLLRKLPLGYFTASSAGKITAELTTTLSGVESASVMVTVGIVSGLFSSLAMALFMLFFDWRIGLITVTGMVLYMGVVSWQMGISRKNAPALAEAQTHLAEAALTCLQGIGVTKAFSCRRGDQALLNAIDKSRDENIRLTRKSMPSQIAASLTVSLFESCILLASLYLCFILQDITLAKALVLILFSFMAYSALNQAGSMLSMIGLMDAGLDEIGKIEEEKPLEEHQPSSLPEGPQISVRNLSFSYGKNPVLRNINADFPAGSFTAIVGPSGSGKTTLCQLIPRFRDGDSGSVSVGGVNVKNIPYDKLMEQISMVFQRVYLFEDTIGNNIRFGKPDATQEEVIKAAKAARCHDFIMKLPQGYDTLVEEGGSSLSGGEKQRISIARAILKDAPIVILDEATSALDAENEQLVLSAMEELTQNKTVIMIAHRLKTVRRADQILVLEHGEITAQGTHESLKNQPGIYHDFLISRQQASGWTLST